MQKISHDSEVPAREQQVITAACALVHKNFNGVEKIFLPKNADGADMVVQLRSS